MWSVGCAVGRGQVLLNLAVCGKDLTLGARESLGKVESLGWCDLNWRVFPYLPAFSSAFSQQMASFLVRALAYASLLPS